MSLLDFSHQPNYCFVAASVWTDGVRTTSMGRCGQWDPAGPRVLGDLIAQDAEAIVVTATAVWIGCGCSDARRRVG